MALPDSHASAKAVLARRREAAQYLQEARLSGNEKEARRWELLLRKLDELITRYGLSRYASHS
jgi:hypothetical protein